MSDISKLPAEQSSASPAGGSARDAVLRETDRCVVCGLCLPHCPTYGLSRSEADSPRGRIALVQGLLDGRLAADDVVAGHLDGCLVCRACETVCPSGVRYGRIIDGGRAALRQQRPERLGRLIRAAADLLLRHARLRRGVHRLARRWFAMGGRPSGDGGVGRIGAWFRDAPAARSWAERYLPSGTPRGRVGLFIGCTGDGFDAATLEAARRLLLDLGYEVRMPRGQVCCGALHRHSGDPDRADALLESNRAAFSGLGLDALVVCASACAGELAERRQASTDTLPPVVELTRFVLDALAEGAPPAGQDSVGGPGHGGVASPLRVMVHVPCSHRNVLRQGNDPRALLSLLRDVDLLAFDDDRCCGAAGIHMLTAPAQADALVAGRIEQLRAIAPQVLVTSNVGCALHLRRAMHRAGIEAEVLLPVALFARHWPAAAVIKNSRNGG